MPNPSPVRKSWDPGTRHLPAQGSLSSPSSASPGRCVCVGGISCSCRSFCSGSSRAQMNPSSELMTLLQRAVSLLSSSLVGTAYPIHGVHMTRMGIAACYTRNSENPCSAGEGTCCSSSPYTMPSFLAGTLVLLGLGKSHPKAWFSLPKLSTLFL